MYVHICTTERDEAGVSPMDFSPCSREFHQLLGLERERKRGGEGESVEASS